MLKRKIKIVNKKFQIKTTLKIMGVSTLSFMILLAIIGARALHSDRNISGTIDRLEHAVETENNIVKAFIEFSSQFTGDRVRLAVHNINNDHEKSMATINGYIVFLRDFTIEYYQLIIIIIAVVVFQTIFYFLFLINFTHRIAGPRYVINQFIQDLIEGKNPKKRELRDKDEFKDVYDKLKILADKLEKKKARASKKSPATKKSAASKKSPATKKSAAKKKSPVKKKSPAKK